MDDFLLKVEMVKIYSKVYGFRCIRFMAFVVGILMFIG